MSLLSVGRIAVETFEISLYESGGKSLGFFFVVFGFEHKLN